MGWTVLYIAFGVVALWLLGEVLLQYKARLRWRLLAFFGFLCVVLGVVLPSVLVIAVGTVAFAAGQTLVTLSFRRGFSTGWALGGKPGTSRRRREVAGPAPGEMQPLAPVEDDPAPADHGGEYPQDGPGPYGDRYENAYEERHGQDTRTPAHGVPVGGWQEAGPGQDSGGQGHEGYGGYGDGGYGGQPDPYAAQPYAPSYQDPYADQAPAHAAAQGTGRTYPAYADAYGSAAQAGGYPSQEDPLTAPGHAPGGGAQGYPAGTDQWSGAQSYYTETPAGGVWVPQQRDVTEPDAGYGYPQVPPQPAYGPGEAAPYPPAGYDGGQGYYGGEHRY